MNVARPQWQSAQRPTFPLAAMPPILQDQGYHVFADDRPLLGIPHFWNVVSNLPFVAVGAA